MTSPEAEYRDYNCRLKMLRAYHHLKDLNSKWLEWYTHDRYRIRFEPDPEALGNFFVMATADDPPIDPFGLIIGDCVQNMRSGLDHLVVDLARHFTPGLSQEIEEELQFPIFGYEDRKGNPGVGSTRFYERGRAGGVYRIRGTDPRTHTIIEGYQPYHRRDDFRAHPLWILNVLSNIDKHRLVHPVVGAFVGIGLRPAENIRPFTGPLISYEGLLKGETKIGRLPFLPGRDMDVQPVLPLEIAFNETSPVAAGRSAGRVLQGIYGYIAHTVFPTLSRYM
jgi:hypothetical protein